MMAGALFSISQHEFKLYTDRGVHQESNYKEFMTWITDGGLRYAYAKQTHQPDAEKLYRQQVAPEEKRHVIIIGAGITGLSAAYELAQVGHQVTILEAEGHVGGRIKTCEEGFMDGLYAEAGAMRLPYSHFLPKHYIDLFGIKTKMYQNKNEQAYIYRYGEKITIKDWNENNDVYSDKLFPGWDQNLTKETKGKLHIKGILELYERTFEPVEKDLGTTPTEQVWHCWIEKWGKLSIQDFLLGTMHQTLSGDQLRPWPKAAIDAFKFCIYHLPLSFGLTTWVRLKIAEVWEDPTYTPADGMDALPKAFLGENKNGWNKEVKLQKNIVFGVRVEAVKENTVSGNRTVIVKGRNTATNNKIIFNGDAVLLTVPLSVLDTIEMPLSLEKRKALVNIVYHSATKVMLQCKTRFWQKDVGQGGFSRTDMKIGELHYPDFNGSGTSATERGILIAYTWPDSNLAFNTNGNTHVITEALRQISKLHPEILEEFEVGKVQVWGNEQFTQGGIAEIKPGYMENMEILVKPTPTIYIAGDTLSWTNGWIHGAIFSGLMQVFSFQALVEKHKDIWNPVTMLLSKKN